MFELGLEIAELGLPLLDPFLDHLGYKGTGEECISRAFKLTVERVDALAEGGSFCHAVRRSLDQAREAVGDHGKVEEVAKLDQHGLGE